MNVFIYGINDRDLSWLVDPIQNFMDNIVLMGHVGEQMSVEFTYTDEDFNKHTFSLEYNGERDVYVERVVDEQ